MEEILWKIKFITEYIWYEHPRLWLLWNLSVVQKDILWKISLCTPFYVHLFHLCLTFAPGPFVCVMQKDSLLKIIICRPNMHAFEILFKVFQHGLYFDPTPFVVLCKTSCLWEPPRAAINAHRRKRIRLKLFFPLEVVEKLNIMSHFMKKKLKQHISRTQISNSNRRKRGISFILVCCGFTLNSTFHKNLQKVRRTHLCITWKQVEHTHCLNFSGLPLLTHTR